MANHIVVWDPVVGRYRNARNGQLATLSEMQAAGVAPASIPTAHRSSGGSIAPPSKPKMQSRFSGEHVWSPFSAVAHKLSGSNASDAPSHPGSSSSGLSHFLGKMFGNLPNPFGGKRGGGDCCCDSGPSLGAGKKIGGGLPSPLGEAGGTGGMGGIGGGIARVFGTVFAVVSTIAHVIGSIISTVVSVIQTIISAILSVARLIVGVLMRAISLLVTGFTALVSVITYVTKATMGLAHDLAMIHANTGMSFTQSKGVTDRFGAFGISSSEVAGFMKDGPMMMRLRSRFLGSPSIADPNFFVGMATSYQRMAGKGEVGRMIANRALDAQFGGSAPDSVRLLANMPVRQIRQQLDYSDRVQSKLGINPEVLHKFSEGIPMLINRIGMLWEAVKTRFAVEIAPLVERTLGFVTEFLSKNIGTIAKIIGRVAAWLVQEFPFYVLNGLRAIADGALWFVMQLLTGAHWIAEGMRGLAGMFEAFSEGQSSFLDVIGNVLEGLDYLSIGLNSIRALWRNFIDGLVDVIIHIIPGLAPAMYLRGYRPTDPRDAWKDVSKGTDFRGDFENFRNSAAPKQWANVLRTQADTFDQTLNDAMASAQQGHDALGNFIDDAENTFKGMGITERIAQGLEDLNGKADTTNKHLDKIAGNTAESKRGSRENLFQVLNGVVANESFMAATR